MISLIHPQRQSRQYAYSERDIAYLEKNGWVREILDQRIGVFVAESPSPAQECSDDEVTTVQAADAPIKKRGRPRKP